jgi:hypothetical protein
MPLYNPPRPRPLFKSNVPFIIPSSGSMGDNGALTVTTAFVYTYPKAYVYLPANAIVAGSAAGWYYTTFSSTTVGTVFNNVYDPSVGGEPTVPTTVPFVTTGPGAYTQDVAAGRQGPSFSLPANTLGTTGLLRFEFGARVVSNANVKSVALRQNTTGLTIPALASTTGINVTAYIEGLSATNSQEFRTYTSIGSSTFNTSPQMLALDTTAALPFNIFPLIATATDYIVLGAVRVWQDA